MGASVPCMALVVAHVAGVGLPFRRAPTIVPPALCGQVLFHSGEYFSPYADDASEHGGSNVNTRDVYWQSPPSVMQEHEHDRVSLKPRYHKPGCCVYPVGHASAAGTQRRAVSALTVSGPVQNFFDCCHVGAGAAGALVILHDTFGMNPEWA